MAVKNLSVNFVNRINCPEEKDKQRYFDEKCKGLMLEVRSSGTKTYFLKYKDARGRYKQMKLGRADDLTVSQARKLAHKYLGEVAQGNDPLAEKEILQNVPTLKQYAQEQYLPFVKSKKKSWKTDETLLRIHIIPKLGDKHLDEVNIDDVSTLHRDLLFARYKMATANRLIVLMRYMYNLALKWEVSGVTKNPTRGFSIENENNGRERFLNENEVKKLCMALKESNNPSLEPIVLFLLLTGARRSEVLCARWEDIDFERNVWKILITKSGKPRVVPLSQSAQKVLHRIPRLEDCQYVFANPKTGKPFRSIYRSWHTARQKAGLEDIRMHDLRHSFASFLINSGRSIYEVGKLLGHTQIKTTMRYAHLDNQTLTDAVNSVPCNDVI
ncbi:MAG: tyrosine-type recombinase/integrase [Bacteroidota bacterium]